MHSHLDYLVAGGYLDRGRLGHSDPAPPPRSVVEQSFALKGIHFSKLQNKEHNV